MVSFQLNHTCNRVGCEGHKGQVVSISEADANWLERHGGGQRVGASAKAEPVAATEPAIEPAAEAIGAEEPSDEEPSDEHTGDSGTAAPRRRKRGQ